MLDNFTLSDQQKLHEARVASFKILAKAAQECARAKENPALTDFKAGKAVGLYVAAEKILGILAPDLVRLNPLHGLKEKIASLIPHGMITVPSPAIPEKEPDVTRPMKAELFVTSLKALMARGLSERAAEEYIRKNWDPDTTVEAIVEKVSTPKNGGHRENLNLE